MPPLNSGWYFSTVGKFQKSLAADVSLPLSACADKRRVRPGQQVSVV